LKNLPRNPGVIATGSSADDPHWTVDPAWSRVREVSSPVRPSLELGHEHVLFTLDFMTGNRTRLKRRKKKRGLSISTKNEADEKSETTACSALCNPGEAGRSFHHECESGEFDRVKAVGVSANCTQSDGGAIPEVSGACSRKRNRSISSSLAEA